MRLLKILLFGCVCVACADKAAAGETFCAKHETLAQILDTKFGEQQQGVGLAGKEAMIEIYVSAKGTFTLVSTDTKGVSCIVGAGDSWEKLEPKRQLSSN